MPTAVSLNLRDGQTNVATDVQLEFKFSRPVALDTLRSALTVTPSTDGSLTAISGQTDYAWSATAFFAQLTTYKVTINAFTDLGHHPFKATEWTFTTTIQPRVVSVTSGGAVIGDGGEIDPGAPAARRSSISSGRLMIEAPRSQPPACHPDRWCFCSRTAPAIRPDIQCRCSR